jgi:hypothetical protein
MKSAKKDEVIKELDSKVDIDWSKVKDLYDEDEILDEID